MEDWICEKVLVSFRLVCFRPWPLSPTTIHAKDRSVEIETKGTQANERILPTLCLVITRGASHLHKNDLWDNALLTFSYILASIYHFSRRPVVLACIPITIASQ